MAFEAPSAWSIQDVGDTRSTRSAYKTHKIYKSCIQDVQHMPICAPSMWPTIHTCLVIYTHVNTHMLHTQMSRDMSRIACHSASNVLFHAATCCNVLQHAATRCNMLQRAATCCNTLQHAATCCNMLQHAATCCNALQRAATCGKMNKKM